MRDQSAEWRYPIVAQGVTVDGILHWRIRDRGDGWLVVFVGSRESELAGATMQLRLEGFEREFVLRPAGDGVFSAEFLVPGSTRASLGLTTIVDRVTFDDAVLSADELATEDY